MNTPSAYFDGIDTHIPTASGGNIHTLDGYVVHEFTGSGTFTPAKTANYQFFMVGPGGSGQQASPTPSSKGGGGGGGGEVVLGSIKLISGTGYSIQVPNPSGAGAQTTFAGMIASEGGEGGTGNASSYTNADGEDGHSSGTGAGASGGGAAVAGGTNYDRTGGESFAQNGIINYIYRYGNAGGNTRVDLGSGNEAAGGGGAGSEGGDANVGVGGSGKGGDGGGGISNDWLGTTLSYGGGGGGYPAGRGYGGGANAATTTNGLPSTPRANSGGGGGGCNSPSSTPPGAAAGIVLIRYKTDV